MRKLKYTFEIMKDAVEKCTSIRGVIQYLGLKEAGGTYSNIGRLIKRHQLDTSHFTGQGWAKGHSRHTHPSLEQISKKLGRTDDEILVVDSPPGVSNTRLREVALRYKEYTCSVCPNGPEWMGKPLTLHLDHINGIRNDNRLENLRFICPNCHQQTPTWGFFNSSKRKDGALSRTRTDMSCDTTP